MNPRLSGIGMTSQRTRMRMVERLRREGIRDEVVLGALAEIPRHIFVDEALASRAYDDVSLPIGFGQTISHPFTVARLCELARDGQPIGRALEIGTGCGYQAAILSRLAQEVFSVERIAQLVSRARLRLRELNCRNIRLKHGDGHQGLKDDGPFDVIVMSAAATHIPRALADQLTCGGRLVLPLGTQQQNLVVVTRTEHGFEEAVGDHVKFVPLLAGVSA